ncbi:hypothetical protein BDN70DRAFT_872860 [Pholiota conissans]|uniref:Uncharacterized protein n=1 Tax=Pholiota conissans TaxID=109636 RepID=A0A9P6CYJ8_9AGAR|nr:hypothetical protein BDN70DRAFT_872860 [Pholiota conissans]
MVVQTGDFTEPVLQVCPIPRNVVAFLGGCHGGRPIYLLWKDGQEITVEVPGHNYYPEYDPSDPFADWKMIQKSMKTFAHYLEIIQMHLDQIRFGETNWAYLLPDKHGGFYIRQREKALIVVTCPLWATMIREDEIEFTVWGQPWDRRGIWKGQEVDILYAWTEVDFLHLDRAMYAYKALAGIDLAFEVYGHLINKDGIVIGLVSAAAKGRTVRPSDRSLIYHTVSTIQQHGFLYRGCITNQFLITPEGKVRLLELFSLVRYPRAKWKQLEKDADIWHWRELGDLFEELKTYDGIYGNCRFPPDRLTASSKNLQLIAPPPGPERPLGGLYLYPLPNFFEIFFIPFWDGFKLAPWVDTGRDGDQHTRRRAIAYGTGSPEGTDASSEPDIDDRPLTMSEISLYRTHRGIQRRTRLVFHPYRANRSRSGVLIYSSDETGDSGSHARIIEVSD